MSEQALIKQIMVAVSQRGGRLWRNNCGAYKDTRGHFIRYGVANPGGSDLIGYTHDGRFLAVEVKYGRTATTVQQAAFVAAVDAAGGVGVVAHCLDDVILALTKQNAPA